MRRIALVSYRAPSPRHLARLFLRSRLLPPLAHLLQERRGLSRRGLRHLGTLRCHGTDFPLSNQRMLTRRGKELSASTSRCARDPRDQDIMIGNILAHFSLQHKTLQFDCHLHANCNMASCSLIAICMQIETWQVAVWLQIACKLQLGILQFDCKLQLDML